MWFLSVVWGMLVVMERSLLGQTTRLSERQRYREKHSLKQGQRNGEDTEFRIKDG